MRASIADHKDLRAGGARQSINAQVSERARDTQPFTFHFSPFTSLSSFPISGLTPETGKPGSRCDH
jgi:hypothetical protein